MASVYLGANILYLRRFATLAGHVLHPVAAAVLLAGVALASSPARGAADADVFAVRDVRVDVTAKTAAAARKIALEQGHGQAFDRLLSRLVPNRERDRVPRLTAATIAELIRDFGVDEEKTSPVRYLATLRVRFKRAAVRRLLRQANVPFAETASKPVLIVPVFRRAGALLLWDQANSWRHAWAALPPSDGLVPIILPRGDLADINDIGPEQALRSDEARFEAIAGRYRAGDILLAAARLGTDAAANTAVLHVNVSRFGAVGQGRTIVRSFSATAGQTVRALLDASARAVRTEVEEAWKRDNLLRFGDERRLTAVMKLNGLRDWVVVRSRLAEVAFVQASDLLSLSRSEATVRLSFIGDEEQLVLALAQRDLSLTRGAVTWVLQYLPAATGGGGQPAAVK